MSENIENPPAFPSMNSKTYKAGGKNSPSDPDYYTISEGGMQLRDYFAAKALQGLLANQEALTGFAQAKKHKIKGVTPAIVAYQMADAMLIARGEK